MSWTSLDDEIGGTGSEGGTILLDDEHADGARITLEEGGAIAPFAITCGIYGWMMHTRFFSSREEGVLEFGRMKAALDEILARIPAKSDAHVEEKMRKVSDAIARFVKQFPT